MPIRFNLTYIRYGEIRVMFYGGLWAWLSKQFAASWGVNLPWASLPLASRLCGRCCCTLESFLVRLDIPFFEMG